MRRPASPAGGGLPSFARKVPGGIELSVKVVPGSSRTAFAGVLGDSLKVRVAAPPEAGKANRALLAFLSEWLDGARVDLLSGHTGPNKRVLARDVGRIDAAALAQIDGGKRVRNLAS